MILSVERVFPVMFSKVFYALPRAAVVFVVAYFASLLLLPGLTGEVANQLQNLMYGVSATASFMYLVAKAIDGMMVTGTQLELEAQSLLVTIKGFTSTSITVPLSQVSNIFVHQSFIDKFFGVSLVVISQVSGSLGVYGFPFEKAQKFGKEFSQRKIQSHR